jgi:AbrB family looped-hinge helix DNA binding protein
MPRITSKGQVTIPKRVREYLGLKPGETVDFKKTRDGRIVVQTAAGEAKRVADQQERMEKALTSLQGTLDLGMTTDEFMRFIRGDPNE